MMSTASALTAWFTQFGIPVYLEGDVPDEAEAPYITLPLKEADWRSQTSYQFMVWYRTASNLEPLAKADEIIAAVEEGARIYLSGGLLVLRVDEHTPTQVMLDNDYRGVRVPLVLNAYHVPGV